MYKIEDLAKYSYFKNKELEMVLDPLSGSIRREFLLEFIHSLIDEKIPFSLYICDIDNFKFINDDYGHNIGDEIVKTTAAKVIRKIMNKGILGRYGGDEFILVCPYVYEYDDMWNLCKDVYDNALRVRNYINNEITLAITATCGAASYPKDGQTFDEIFKKADKALYRGKRKGRNCFIIYLDEKHKNIDVVDRKNHLMLGEMITKIYDILVSNDSLQSRIDKAFDLVLNQHLVSAVSFVKEDNLLYFKSEEEFCFIKEELLKEIMENEDIVIIRTLTSILNTYPNLHEFCFKNKIKSFVAVKVNAYGKNFGTLIIQDSKLKRIWQKDDIATYSYLAKTLGLILMYENN